MISFTATGPGRTAASGLHRWIATRALRASLRDCARRNGWRLQGGPVMTGEWPNGSQWRAERLGGASALAQWRFEGGPLACRTERALVFGVDPQPAADALNQCRAKAEGLRPVLPTVLPIAIGDGPPWLAGHHLLSDDPGFAQSVFSAGLLEQMSGLPSMHPPRWSVQIRWNRLLVVATLSRDDARAIESFIAIASAIGERASRTNSPLAIGRITA